VIPLPLPSAAPSPLGLQHFRSVLLSVRAGLLADLRAGLIPGSGVDPSPAGINDGLCELFASRVLAALPPSLRRQARGEWIDGLPTDSLASSHYVIFFANRVYDAECIEGANELRLLPFFLAPPPHLAASL
jgi:hypothetical protein